MTYDIFIYSSLVTVKVAEQFMCAIFHKELCKHPSIKTGKFDVVLFQVCMPKTVSIRKELHYTRWRRSIPSCIQKLYTSRYLPSYTLYSLTVKIYEEAGHRFADNSPSSIATQSVISPLGCDVSPRP